VPGLPAKLAVGDRLQAGVALQRDYVDDSFVLGFAQRVCVDLARLEIRASLCQCWRPQQAADVVSAEGGLVRLPV